ncbi:MerR family transcriptional regulator [Brachybacterium squillarum]|uniref:MerR family transcriptional regulator n=1 Tax=Brachybacterium squillarum TaxID=661979 RepID=UPI00026296F5|nr:MerR family transcriptional regulator [Brachybacterium squillarum]
MRISALSEQTGLPVGTIKFYLREGVLPHGRRTSRTSAEYDESHLERIRLIRALTEVGGLEIAQVRRVVEVIESPAPPPIELMATAQRALTGAPPEPSEGSGASGRDHGAPAGGGDPGAEGPSRARRWAEDRGWSIPPDDQLVARLEAAWSACDDAGMELTPELLHEYAAPVEEIARIDVAHVPREPEAAVRRVILGTVLGDAVLASLRLLAQREAGYASMRAAQKAQETRQAPGAQQAQPSGEAATGEDDPA